MKELFQGYLSVFSLSKIKLAVNTVSLREEVLKVKGLREMKLERPISITEKNTLRADLGKTKFFYCKSPILAQVQ